MGRKLATVEEAESEFIVHDAIRFTARGTGHETFLPFVQDTSACPTVLRGPRTVMHYDAKGREVLHDLPPDADDAISHVTTGYQPLRRTVIDELAHEHAYVSDGLKRLTQVEEVNRGDRYVTTYMYNPEESLTRIIDAQSNVKRLFYDGLQRKVFLNDLDRGVMSYTYDDASNLRETVDAKGQRITYTYDGANRLLTEDYHDEGLPFSANQATDVLYHYDTPAGAIAVGDGTMRTATETMGFLSWVSDRSGEEHTSYDPRGRVTWVLRRVRDPETGVLTPYKTETTYDSLDRVRTTIYPDNDRVEYGYDTRGLLHSITGGPSGYVISDIQYRPSGQMARCAYGNGMVTTYDYDPRLRLTTVATAPAGNRGNPFVAYSYKFDGASNIRRIDDIRPTTVVPSGNPARNTQVFEYDDLNRLTRVQYSFAAPGVVDHDDGHIAYAYDRIGNMTSQVSDLDAVEDNLPLTNLGMMAYGGPKGAFAREGRQPGGPPGPHALTGASVASRAYTYDDNGNMTAVDGKTLTWDFKDRLVAVQNASTRAEYVYNYLDQRVLKRVFPKAGPEGTGVEGPSTTTYVGRQFEVREPGEPIKYVFNANTRVARVTGSLDPSALRIQRVYLRAGWNLVSLAVDVSNAVIQMIGMDPAVRGIYRWEPSTGGFVIVNMGDSLPAGSVFWVDARLPTTLQVIGSLAEPATVVLNEGPTFFALRWLAASTIDLLLPSEITDVWFYDAIRLRWTSRLRSGLISDAPKTVTPGEGLFVVVRSPAGISFPYPSDRVRYYHQDHLGSSDTTVDTDGLAPDGNTFYPFGHPRHRTQHAVTRDVFLFVGKEQDTETGLSNFGGRLAITSLARFLSVDPAESAGGNADPQRLNSYAYGLNNPVRFVDPDGRSPSDWADWFDQQRAESETILENVVQDHPGPTAVVTAAALSTAMAVASGFVDVLRLGQGAAEGGWKGYGKDALRAAGIAGGISGAASTASSALRTAVLAGRVAKTAGAVGQDAETMLNAMKGPLTNVSGELEVRYTSPASKPTGPGSWSTNEVLNSLGEFRERQAVPESWGNTADFATYLRTTEGVGSEAAPQLGAGGGGAQTYHLEEPDILWTGPREPSTMTH